MRACLRSGIGFTVCPEISVQKELEKKKLEQIQLEQTDDVSLIMIWHVGKWCSPLLKDFMKITEEKISSHS
jgi:DNA-binding transcriptional LysR family regulator